ncbi:MAG: penicillin-binding protein 2 [Actinobacteria bacterium]|nr:penicillin-binding protein 2 [Actinomycetota bacterium]
MTRQIRALAVVLMVCFTFLFVQVNLLQVGDRSCAGVIGAIVGSTTCRNDLDRDPLNRRAMLRDFARPRGSIATADGVVIAKSVDSHDRYVYQRVYPAGSLYGQITGYYSFVYGSSGLEAQYNDDLAGRTASQRLESLSDLFSNTDTSGNLTITIRNDLQQAAQTALGDRTGTVVVLDPRSGAVRAMWSNPNFDPNPISHHDSDTVHTARDAKNMLAAAPGHPLVNAAVGALYAPGSTMKLVTGSVGVDLGKVTPDQPVYPPAKSYQPPYGSAIANFSGETCGGTLFTILAVSCNSAFAQMGTETIGPAAMLSGAARFGFDAQLPIDLPGPKAESTIRPPKSTQDPNGDFTHEIPQLSLASIGQGPTVVTPLQMAMVTAAIADDGVIMTPHLLDVVRDSNGNVTRRWRDRPWRRATTAQTAKTMQDAMREVVTNGTAMNMAIPGYDVGAKTGTAELANNQSNNAWMAAWAGLPGQTPSVVVVVVVPNVPGYGNAATGSVVAGPVALAVMRAALADGS